MPWKPKDAKRHTDKAKGKKLSRVWAQVANDTLERESDHGTAKDDAEAIAIRSANAVVARVKGKGKKKRAVEAQLMGHNGSVGAGDGPIFAEAGDQANLVENEFLPKIGEHWARVAEPETFNHISINACDVEAGVRCIQGTLKDGDGTQTPMAYHFDKKVFPSIAEVQRWLGKRGLQATKLEPAKDLQYPKMTCGADIDFEASGEVNFHAISAAAAHTDNLPTIDILAYNGGPLTVKGYDLPVVVDIPTLRVDPEQTPIVKDHDETQRVGHARVTKTGSDVRLAGVISSVEAAAKEVVADARNGFRWKASIGCRMADAEFTYYAPGETLAANGQSFSGPLYYARHAKLAHCALVTNGADDRSQVQIAASAAVAAAHSMKGKLPMPTRVVPADVAASTSQKPKFKKWLRAKGHDPAALDAAKKAELRAQFDGELQAAAPVVAVTAPAPTSPDILALRQEHAGELQRIQSIRKLSADLLAQYGGHADPKTIEAVQKIEFEAISKGEDVRDAEVKLLRMARPVGPGIHVHGQQPLQAEVLEAAACETLNLSNIDSHFKPELRQAARDRFHGQMSLQQLMLEAAWANGCQTRFVHGPADVRDVMRHACPPLEAAEASTISLPNILSNLLNKQLLEGFSAVESVWRDVAQVASAKDFKPQYGLRIYGDMTFEALGDAGEIKHGKVGELKYTTQVDLRARMFSTSYVDIINDDLSALSQIPRLIGMGAAYDLNQRFWTTWLANKNSQGATMWATTHTTAGDTGNSNYVSGSYTDEASETQTYGLTATAGVATLTKMKQLFLEQAKPDGSPVAVAPAVLLSPPARADMAKRLVQSSELRSTVAGATYPIDNPHAGLFKLAISSYLATAFGLTGASDTASWLLADPAVLPTAMVYFLNGQQTPTVQSSEADFSTLSFVHRGWWAHGISLQDFRGSVMQA